MEITNPQGCEVKRCTECKTTLDESNWNPYYRKEGNYLCRTCENKKENAWTRKRLVYTARGSLLGDKRPFPSNGKCELCNIGKAYPYHHWDDSNIYKGIWCCQKCHIIIEGFENLFKFAKLVGKYLWMKILRNK